MTDTEKKEYIKKLLIKFGVTTAAVFTGTTLSILLCANILKPKCPCPMRKMPPGIERPMRGHHMQKGQFGPRYHKDFQQYREFGPRHNRNFQQPNQFRPEAPYQGKIKRQYNNPNNYKNIEQNQRTQQPPIPAKK